MVFGLMNMKANKIVFDSFMLAKKDLKPGQPISGRRQRGVVP